jgi:Flp pilus assembly protein TadG
VRKLLPRRGRTKSRGQALVEFALVFPVFILMFFGLIDVGRLVYDYSTLTNANRQALRLSIVNQNVDAIKSTAISEGISMGLTPINVVYIGYKKPGDPALGTKTPEDAANCETVAPGCIAVVKVQYTWTAITPVIGKFIGPVTLTNTTEMPVERAYIYP